MNKIFSFATRVKLLGTALICLSGFVLADPLARLLNFSQPELISLAFLLSAATTYYEHIMAMLQSLHRFTQVALINILQALLKSFGALALFVTGSTVSAPIFAFYMLAPGLPLLLFPYLFPKWTKLKLKDSFTQEKKVLAGLAKHSTVAFISAGIIENIDVLFVQGYLNTYEAGLLGGVSRVALLFSILAYALGSVLNTRAARYKHKKDVKAFLTKASVVALAVMGSFLVFLPLSKFLLLLTIGSQYLPGLTVMNILVAASLLSVAVVPFIALFFSFDVPWYFSVSGLLQLLIIVVGNAVFVPVYGLEATAWTRLVARLALFIFTAWLAVHTYHKTYGKRA